MASECPRKEQIHDEVAAVKLVLKADLADSEEEDDETEANVHEAMQDPVAQYPEGVGGEEEEEKEISVLKHEESGGSGRPILPGAVSMRGVLRDLSGSDDTQSDDLEDPTIPESESRHETRILQAEVVHQTPVEAYRVTEEEETGDRNKPLVEATPDRRASYLTVLALLVIVFLGVTVGLIVSQVDSSSSSGEDRLLVTFLFNSKQEGTFIEGRQFVTVEDGDEVVVTTRGNSVEIECVVGACKDIPGACRVTTDPYKEGCCFGVDCPEDEFKCGENCPVGACAPGFDGCISPECYVCDTGPDGEQLYRMRDTTGDIICINYGTTNTEDANYDWVVYCVEIIEGGHEESNLNVGEYYCQAMRKGHVGNLTLSHGVPCQYIQLGECGCGPLNMFPFDLEHPTKPCETKDDCRFLCSDAPNANPQDLCDAFTIGWWEGDNWMGVNTFFNPWERPDVDFDIIIFDDKN